MNVLRQEMQTDNIVQREIGASCFEKDIASVKLILRRKRLATANWKRQFYLKLTSPIGCRKTLAIALRL